MKMLQFFALILISSLLCASSSSCLRQPETSCYENVENPDCQIYFASPTNNTINRVRLDGSGMEVILDGLDSPHGLTFDYATRKMYFTEWNSSNIMRADMDGHNLETLYKGENGGGLGIAIDPDRGMMFWSEYYNGLYKGSMNGDTPAILLVSSEQLGVCSGGVSMGVALDPANQQVYFASVDTCFESANNRKIWSVHYDGSGLTPLYWPLDNTSALALDHTFRTTKK
jgi:DNA-binding beta-propeller fold protein YncE